MKQNRSGVELCMLIGLVMLLCLSCSLFPMGYGKRFSREQCEDPAWISLVGDSYSYQYRSSKNAYDSITINFKGFFGRDTVFEISTDHTVLLTYELDRTGVQAEMYKVVLVHEETGEVETLSEVGDDASGHLALRPGKHTIKLVGYNAHGQLCLKLNVPQGVLVVDRFSERW
nr:hypothetical protein [uncultured Sphaerochaeta sp.]